MPTLYDLYWDPGAPMGGTFAAAPLAKGAAIFTPVRVPAAILYPAFGTAAVYFPDDPETGEFFELLLATPDSVTLTPEDVNLRLGITRGLGWCRPARMEPLFPGTDERIEVVAAEPQDGILATHSQFRGALHRLWARHYDPAFSNARFWSVRVHHAALARARDASDTRGLPIDDIGDEAIARLFKARNGPDFQRPLTFTVRGNDVLPEYPVKDRPVLAHHPLAVFPKNQRVLRKVAHVSDVHMNMRQDLLAQTDARIAEVVDECGKEVATDLVPPIGQHLHRYSRSVFDILSALDTDTDALCVGGDLVDHIRNASPRKGMLLPANAAAVWDSVALQKATYAANYQSSPDFIAAFTILRHICHQRQLPIFAVTGNHDAYLDGYGISPRVSNSRALRLLANEGIAKDHNLTLYEAILAFGPTYHEYDGYGDVRGWAATAKAGSSNFHADWMDWYYTAFTPWADAVVRMPSQRVVALGWGDAEHMIGLKDDGQGMGHLPRATEALNPRQFQLLKEGYGPTCRTLLVTHFTFASFADSIAESPEAAENKGARPWGDVRFRAGTGAEANPYTQFDMGTFVVERDATYRLLMNEPAGLSAVLTGHSHRKALYFIGPRTAGSPEAPGARWSENNLVSPVRAPGARVTMVGLAAGGVDLAVPALRDVREQAPVVLSDSAGPIAASNVRHEFGTWGGDSPAGSLLTFDPAGKLSAVRVARARSAPRPRAAVSLEYRHHQDGAVWDGQVFEFMTAMLRDGQWQNPVQKFWIPLQQGMTDLGMAVAEVRLLGRLAAADGAEVPTKWNTIIAATPTGATHFDAARRRTFAVWQVGAEHADALRKWFSIGSSADRFVALRFSPAGLADPAMAARYNWDSWWTFEVVAERYSGLLEHFAERWRVRPVGGGWFGDEMSPERPVPDQPDFEFRRELLPSKYRDPLISLESRKS
jgi:hypothetical protein